MILCMKAHKLCIDILWNKGEGEGPLRYLKTAVSLKGPCKRQCFTKSCFFALTNANLKT